MQKPVYVIGHRNPDTDSICSALAYAHLKRETGLPRGYIDVVLWRSLQQKLISVDDYLHRN